MQRRVRVSLENMKNIFAPKKMHVCTFFRRKVRSRLGPRKLSTLTGRSRANWPSLRKVDRPSFFLRRQSDIPHAEFSIRDFQDISRVHTCGKFSGSLTVATTCTFSQIFILSNRHTSRTCCAIVYYYDLKKFCRNFFTSSSNLFENAVRDGIDIPGC